jgi:hypothetical protein
MFAALNAFMTRSVAGYFINKSLRFRSSASAYLNRTAGTPTAQTKYTISVWVKRGTSTSAYYSVFSAGSASANDYDSVQFNTANTLAFFTGPGAGSADLVTTQLFRDYAAWYHIIVAVDTTQATASNRVKFYVNGTQVTSFTSSTYPSLNGASAINRSGAVQAIGALYAGSYNQYLDGELAEFNFIDGQQLAPTALGAFSIYNQWLPIKYAGTYGTNGFYLPFSNTTSTSTLVADSSGNGNNWTPNNISLTTGSTYDSLTDVPTLTSKDVANYAVLNPLNVGGSPTLSNGNLTIPWGTSFTGNVLGTIPINSGKWYWEIGFSASLSGCAAGIASSGFSNSTLSPQSAAPPYAHTLTAAGVFWENDNPTNYFTAFTASDILGIKLDYTNDTVYFYKNNTLVTTSSIETSQLWYPIFYKTTTVSASQNINFGQQPFVYTLPTGFLALNTFNI